MREKTRQEQETFNDHLTRTDTQEAGDKGRSTGGGDQGGQGGTGAEGHRKMTK